MLELRDIYVGAVLQHVYPEKGRYKVVSFVQGWPQGILIAPLPVKDTKLVFEVDFQQVRRLFTKVPFGLN
jgi:hypothetical protein